MFIFRFFLFSNMLYKALVVEEVEGKFKSTVKELDIESLPDNEVLIKVLYSSLNYKDALSATGNKGVTKYYPHTPGIDAAGVVVSANSDAFFPGTEVIVTGFDLGMNTPGGFGQYIRVPASWVTPMPAGLTPKESMIIGTAGFTAGISVQNLISKVKPGDAEVLVSGATGGVGSMAVSILSKLGYKVVAISGKESETDFLLKLGAQRVISRADFMQGDDKALFPAQYAGAIDTVGGDILVRLIKSVQLMGVVTTCGSVASTKLDLNVFPFILRAVSLVGISAQNFPAEDRPDLWNKLATAWKPDHLEALADEIELDELPAKVDAILKGSLKGRTLVRLFK